MICMYTWVTIAIIVDALAFAFGPSWGINWLYVWLAVAAILDILALTHKHALTRMAKFVLFVICATLTLVPLFLSGFIAYLFMQAGLLHK